MTNEDRKVIELALEALEDIKDDCSGCEFEWSNDYPLQAKAHTAIKKVLARGEQEPVACIHRIVDVTNKVVKSGYMCMDCGAVFRAYTTPPQRKPLTDEEMQFLATAIGQAKQIIDTYNTEFVTARDDLRRCSELLAAHGIKE